MIVISKKFVTAFMIVGVLALAGCGVKGDVQKPSDAHMPKHPAHTSY